tara:strand:+ start:1431 stop:1706 length:276 start_codon:yes stop_codon:yes gene_type:complete
MHTSITVGLTTCQWQSLEHIAEDPKDWFTSWANFRANEAAKDISQLYVNHKIDNGQPIVAVGVTAMVQAAYDENIIVTARKANETSIGRTM